jgi:hypothetical protein
MSENNNDIVIINLDRPRVLRFGHKALKQIEAMTGNNIDDFDLANFGFDDIEKIMWYGLSKDAKENNETLKLEDMEDLLDHADSEAEILEKMNLAFTVAFGGHVQVDEKN